MSRGTNPHEARLLELLAERATQGVSEAQEQEIAALLAECPDINPDSFDLAAGALAAAWTPPAAEPLPRALADRIAAQGREFVAQPRPGADGSTTARRPAAGAEHGPFRFPAWAGWLAAAACLALAVGGWWKVLGPAPTARSQWTRMAATPGVVRIAMAPWADTDQKNAAGELLWDEPAQHGMIRFTGLKPNNKASQQYQIWIVDERGMDSRISGGVFDIPAGATEVMVPINPSIAVRNAGAFAVTMENAGGVVVSDMSHKVVIGAKN